MSKRAQAVATVTLIRYDDGQIHLFTSAHPPGDDIEGIADNLCKTFHAIAEHVQKDQPQAEGGEP